MDAVDLLRKYQALAPDGSPLLKPRTAREFAALLGIHESQLSRYFSGQQQVGFPAMQGLSRAFPRAAAEIVGIILAGPPEGLTEDREREAVAS
jgi:transcriptional regulator with XRE-family HTH domain